MEITLFYSKKQRDTLLKSGLKPEMLYFLRGERIPDEKWKEVEKGELEAFPGLVDILKEIGETKRIIDPVVDGYVQRIEVPEVKEIVEYITKSPSWRERPLIMRLATKALGSEYSESLVHASAGLELFEESAVLLDDVLDEAEVCVGKESAWRKYGVKETFMAHGVLTSLARMAILESCKKANLNAEKTKEVIRSFEEIYYGDYVGQYMDVDSEKRVNFSEKDYFEMISKTPGTQFANALEIVCVLTGKEEFKKDLKEFGQLFGMAAQLRDDIVDIIGDEEVVYKKLLTDILRKKKRLPLILLLQEVPEHKELFTTDVPIIEDQLSEMLSRIHENGIIRNCISRVKDLTNRAIAQLGILEDNSEKKLLKQLTLILAKF